MTARVAALFAIVVFVPLAPCVRAASTEPAVAQVHSLTEALEKSMRAGGAASMAQRYRDLEPVVERVFALPLMTRVSVGPDWSTFSPGEQEAVLAAFTRYTVASYAHNFREADGKKFEIDDAAASRGQDRIVRARLVLPREAPATLLYRLHDVQGTWKVVDVYYDGVSELNLRRTDFSAALGSGGVAELIAHLNRLSGDLMKP